MKRKRILIINTGGTIGMQPASSGFRPVRGFLGQQLAEFPEFRDEQMPQFEVLEYEPLLDSANFSPLNWLQIATDIRRHHDSYDAFIVLHGTDTMAYTASALAFMLPGLNRNVIVTGSQLPLCLRRTDARENLVTALIVAGEHFVPEVCVLFGSVLLRGCRTTKTSATRFDAFESPNYPQLASIGTRIRVFPERIRQTAASASAVPELVPIEETAVATVRLFPGFDPAILRNVLQIPLRGLVLESYGTGNGPAGNRQFLQVLQEAVDRGVLIVNLSQCLHGGVSQTEYASGRALHDAGVVSGGDMTVEAALTKLMLLLGQGSDTETVRRRIGQDMAGEITLAT